MCFEFVCVCLCALVFVAFCMPVDTIADYNPENTFKSRLKSARSSASNRQSGTECVTVKVILNDVVDDDGEVYRANIP